MMFAKGVQWVGWRVCKCVLCSVCECVNVHVHFYQPFLSIFLNLHYFSEIVAYSIDDVVLSITDNDVLVSPDILISRYNYVDLVTGSFTENIDGGECLTLKIKNKTKQNKQTRNL